MPKILLASFISLTLILLSLAAHAIDSQFFSNDMDWRQKMLEDFKTKSGRVDYSYPPGLYRMVCRGCETDLVNLRCAECLDARGMPLSNSQVKMNNCLKFYDTTRAELKCEN
jgi:hypothetical protein